MAYGELLGFKDGQPVYEGMEGRTMTNITAFYEYGVYAIEEARTDAEGTSRLTLVVVELCGQKYRMSAGVAAGLAEAIKEASEAAASANIATSKARTKV